MRVWLQEVDDTQRDGVNPEAIQCDHTECFPDDPEEAARIGEILDVDDQAFVGGGAAQLYLLTRVRIDNERSYSDIVRDGMDE
jgi:hypothetical protein